MFLPLEVKHSSSSSEAGSDEHFDPESIVTLYFHSEIEFL